VAIASKDAGARVGIDVERAAERAPSFERAAFSARERELLDRLGGDRAEWVARLWTAKEAAAKATGLAGSASPSSVEARSARPDGVVAVALGPELAAARPELGAGPHEVRTERRSEHVWAWTVMEPATGRPHARRPQFSEAER